MYDRTRIYRRTLIRTALGGAAWLVTAPAWALMPTARQTEGPFFPDRERADTDFDLTRIDGHSERAEGEVIDVVGRVLDENGAPVANARVDVWQANVHGRYDHQRDPNPAPLDPNFQGWGVLTTDAEGRYRFRTIKPGAYRVAGDWSRPPHIHFKVRGEGFDELTTQMYFAGEPLNEPDRVLGAVPAAQRPALIVDFASAGADGVPRGQFDLVVRRA